MDCSKGEMIVIGKGRKKGGVGVLCEGVECLKR